MLWQKYYVYILTNRRGTLYTGLTNSLIRRIREHREGKEGFTAKYRINRLIFYEGTNNIEEAIIWEKQIKGWLRSKKLALVRSLNPQFRDLSYDFDPPVRRRAQATVRRESRLSGEGRLVNPGQILRIRMT